MAVYLTGPGVGGRSWAGLRRRPAKPDRRRFRITALDSISYCSSTSTARESTVALRCIPGSGREGPMGAGAARWQKKTWVHRTL